MTDFFTLRDCSEINIDNNSVERIEMFGDIVWEKIRATTTTLSIEPAIFDETTNTYNITKNNTFTLKASTIDSKNTILQNGTIIFSNGTQSYNREITEGTASLSLTASSVGDYTWTATFQKTKKHKQSKNTIKIKIKKDKPKLEIINKTTIIYNGWKVGARLTSSNGIPIVGEEYRVCANRVMYHHAHTSEKGVLQLNINTLPANADYEITFYFDGNNEYEAVSISRTFSVKQHKTMALYPVDWTYTSSQPPHQKWQKIDNKFQCYKESVPYCNDSQAQTIASYSGLRKQPSPLIIAFPTPSAPEIFDSTLVYMSNQKPACPGSYGGVLFNDPPTISIQYNGEPYIQPDENHIGDKSPVPFEKFNYYNGYWASKGPLRQEARWDHNGLNEKKPITPGLIHVMIEYPPNEGYEEGCLTIQDVQLIVSYVEDQPERNEF